MENSKHFLGLAQHKTRCTAVAGGICKEVEWPWTAHGYFFTGDKRITEMASDLHQRCRLVLACLPCLPACHCDFSGPLGPWIVFEKWLWGCSWLLFTVRQKKRWARALHWTNTRGRETFFWMFIPIQGCVRYLTSLGWCGQKWSLCHKSLQKQPDNFFLPQAQLDAKRCREKEEELYGRWQAGTSCSWDPQE